MPCDSHHGTKAYAPRQPIGLKSGGFHHSTEAYAPPQTFGPMPCDSHYDTEAYAPRQRLGLKSGDFHQPAKVNAVRGRNLPAITNPQRSVPCRDEVRLPSPAWKGRCHAPVCGVSAVTKDQNSMFKRILSLGLNLVVFTNMCNCISVTEVPIPNIRILERRHQHASIQGGT